MRINNPSFEIWPQEAGIDGVYKQIERVGRVCYKSEDHRTADSARPFVERMIKNEHYAMLEHGTVYMCVPVAETSKEKIYNRFSHTNIVGDNAYITTNLRVLAENKWLDDLQFLCEPTEHHERRVTVHFTTQIAITREFNRHRADSMAEQSTRYCNYSKAKFGNEIAVCLPEWVQRMAIGTEWEQKLAGGRLDMSGAEMMEISRKVADGSATVLDTWALGNLAAEKAYLNLIAAGCKPQEARAVLPLDTLTELVHTAFLSDWKHFFDLRALGTTGAPHPDAKALALPLYEEFKKIFGEL